MGRMTGWSYRTSTLCEVSNVQHRKNDYTSTFWMLPATFLSGCTFWVYDRCNVLRSMATFQNCMFRCCGSLLITNEWALIILLVVHSKRSSCKYRLRAVGKGWRSKSLHRNFNALILFQIICVAVSGWILRFTPDMHCSHTWRVFTNGIIFVLVRDFPLTPPCPTVEYCTDWNCIRPTQRIIYARINHNLSDCIIGIMSCWPN